MSGFLPQFGRDLGELPAWRFPNQAGFPHVKWVVYFPLSRHSCLLRIALWEYLAPVSMQQPIFLH